MRTVVFAYKNFIGIKSDMKAEGLENDPSQPGQLGFVLDAKAVDVQPEALVLLKNLKKSHDDIGDIDVFQAKDKVIFAFLGGPWALYRADQAEGSRNYAPELLTATEEVQTPEDFKEYIDKEILKGT